VFLLYLRKTIFFFDEKKRDGEANFLFASKLSLQKVVFSAAVLLPVSFAEANVILADKKL